MGMASSFARQGHRLAGMRVAVVLITRTGDRDHAVAARENCAPGMRGEA
jgi:hypothetical protein